MELTPEQAERRAHFRAIADARITPVADQWDHQGSVPCEVIELLASEGLLGAILPAKHGGLDLDALSLGLLAEELGRGSVSLASLLTVHSMCSAAVLRLGTDDQRQTWLPRLAAGEAIGAFALTEPGTGSDAKSLKTRATRTTDGWTLDGTKRWISFGQVADVFLLFATSDEGVCAFLVEADSPGLEIRPIDGMLGFRAASLAELGLDRCRLPDDSLVGRPGLGFTWVANQALDLGRYTIAWASTGMVRACLDASLRYASTREQFGVPIKEHQLVRAMLADMWTDAEAAELLCANAGRLREDGDPDSVVATATAKYFSATAATRAASNAVQIHGANGCSGHYPVQRYFRDAKVLEIIEGSTQIQQLLISHSALARYGETP
jgi:alkylation response protein AidB-like acyl-CoA dehydrogenase